MRFHIPQKLKIPSLALAMLLCAGGVANAQSSSPALPPGATVFTNPIDYSETEEEPSSPETAFSEGWSGSGTSTARTRSVPEPSAVIGLTATVGLTMLRKKKRASAPM
ncbi:PEP-CTERM sorting domain-containing protein [[Phormidium] sp. ETS-05]|uniref:PEP-CTERM sorting domain-containing protein n=1 Tax=[Phormidium] sp. ETS-05 TaxID=222819 RepID=UPI0018EEF4EF|nr:PEP-CTERM sorting domain-containing protein [[Phormidium] sp. ETS-05]